MAKEKGKKNAEISARVARIIDLFNQNPNSFAKRLGYSRAQTIYDILEGKSAPSYDFFNRFVLSEFSVSFNLRWLLAGEGDPFLENKRNSPSPKSLELLTDTSLISYMKEKDALILEQAGEIGRLKEKVRILEEELGKKDGTSDVLGDFLEEVTSAQCGAEKVG